MSKKSFVFRYGLAIVFGVLTLIAEKYLAGYFNIVFLSLPLVAVVLFTFILGADAGIIFCAVAGAGIWYFFVEPENVNKIIYKPDIDHLIAYFLASGIIVYLIGIAERARDLRSAIKCKETLLKELYHRTKNNLNAVSGLLNLQMISAKDPEVQKMFNDAQGRIRSMALVHEMLYRTEGLSELDMKDYLQRLARSVVSGYGTAGVRLKLDLASVPVSLPVAINCGLIVNELLSNSMEHAFPNGGGGDISLSLKTAGSLIEMICSDNGTGFPEGFQIERSGSLGLKLVDTLVRKELLGSLEIPAGEGANVIIRFDASCFTQTGASGS